MSSRMPNPIGEALLAPPFGRAGVVALAYFASGEVGYLLSLRTQEFATFWPPVGILVAALVLTTKLRHWPALILAAFAVNVASNVLLHNKSVLVSLGFGVANCGEAFIGAWLLRRFAGLPFTLERVKDVLALASSAMVATTFGATVGAGVVELAFDAPYWPAWQIWWSGDALGMLVVAPLVFTWTAKRTGSFAVKRRVNIVEVTAIFIGLTLAAEAVFAGWLPKPFAIPALVLPFLLWAGWRCGPVGAATAVLIVGVIGLWNTTQGSGPYIVLSTLPAEQHLRGQTTLAIISLSILLLTAVVAERKQAEQERTKLIGELEQALAEIKTLQGLIPVCAWCKKIQDTEGFWQKLEDYLRTHTHAEFTHGICPECLDKQMATIKPRQG